MAMPHEEHIPPMSGDIGSDMMAEILQAIPYREGVLRIDAIGTDRSYQRALAQSRVNYLANNWDARVAHVLRVNQRPDGSYWVMDGQHRLRGAEKAGKTHVLCHIYHLPEEEEPTMFHLWNTNSAKAQPKDVFRARLAAHEEKAQAILQIVEECGYVLDLGAVKTDAPDHIACVRTLEQLYDDHRPFASADYDSKTRRNAPRPAGPRPPAPQRLRECLWHLKNTWPDAPGATHETIVRAIDRINVKWGHGELQWSSFYLKVGAMEPRMLARRAAEQAKIYHAASDTLVLQEMIRVYNMSKRRNRIHLPGLDDAVDEG